MAIRVLKNKQFARWARSERLTDKKLCAAVHEIESGLVDARLGGFLIKKREVAFVPKATECFEIYAGQVFNLRTSIFRPVEDTVISK